MEWCSLVDIRKLFIRETFTERSMKMTQVDANSKFKLQNINNNTDLGINIKLLLTILY